MAITNLTYIGNGKLSTELGNLEYLYFETSDINDTTGGNIYRYPMSTVQGSIFGTYNSSTSQAPGILEVGNTIEFIRNDSNVIYLYKNNGVDYFFKSANVSGYNSIIGGAYRSSTARGYYTGVLCIIKDGNGVYTWGYTNLYLPPEQTATVYYDIIDPTTDSYGYVVLTDPTNEVYISYITQTQSEFIRRFNNIFEGYTPVTPSDPYDGAGDSTTGGGGGSFDGSSDPIDIPSLPTVGATNTGFISLFVPSESQVRSVANYLWSSLFDVSTFFKIFENPMDCILGLSVVPVTVPTSGSAQITVGNIELSGISLPLASAQYVEVDCGTISFEDKFFGSYLDYEPYTKMSIFLPYCGVHQINADDIMGKVIGVVYHVDILTGSCVAFVKCGDSVLYQFNGACATNIPITNISYNSTIENAIRIAVNIGTTVATAGASAPLSAGAETVGHTAQNIARGVSLAGSTAEGALSLKPSIGRSGALGGTTGILAGQKPYLIITRPRLCKPKNQDFYKGYPSFVQTTVGDLIGKGYTEFDTVIISTLYLTDNEETELERILRGGVYL